ncbi:hypothetical protein POM88_054456 [Heracleum sosnowskyi]|uniref:Bulb-type lectin domain-containing protein n=1 Tax=Heracleum sosnowskyi TaxID=360622 RepID=A0AAD8GN58_9APIA|nr:hypothetical protein POM88_054456 [Heracleum sosnowskyi]
MSSRFSFPILISQLLLIWISLAQTAVPANKNFKYTNEDFHSSFVSIIPLLLPSFLGLRMGNRHSESTMRWVWDANRAKPVREKATLTFGTDGNLVLADVDGTVAWQTGTANKDVIGLELLPDGNLVLVDSKGKFVWQSFDHQWTSPGSISPFQWTKQAIFHEQCYTTSSGSASLSRAKYNATYSMLRISSDGNLKIYTYEEHVDYGAWEVTYVLFDRDEGRESECKMPQRCGLLGVCEDDQCVACPRPNGLTGWSKSCAPPVLSACVGVEHFTNGVTSGSGPTIVGDCRKKCDSDCECLGFFYREESSMCLLAPALGTLNKVDNQSHVAYIKMSK